MEGVDSTSTTDSFSDDVIVYRAILKKAWIDPRQRRVLPMAFIRRPAPKDSDGLSVGHSCPVREYLSRFDKSFGAARIEVGSVRELALDVVPDPDPAELHHALIVGVPYQDDDLAHAEFLAAELAARAGLLTGTE